MFRLIVAAFVTLFLVACERDVTSAERNVSVNTIGTIRELDKDARTMVLRIDGRFLTMTATEQMVNFDQLEAGDRVRVQYEEAVAVRMALPEEEDLLVVQGAAVAAPAGGLPGALSGEAALLSATFLDYDQQTKRVRLELADGTFLSAYVPRELRGFTRARERGDQILIGSTTSRLISVEPAQ